ncbi:hypothetical protein [Salinarimonas sp.]|uniref:hypothetical protein n=1 Tax=Salinarimonas sp. TaxID=2766526 RepID=UPI0032D96FF5
MADEDVCAIHRFEERDIDLLLAEELRVQPAFASWFASQALTGLSLRVPACRTRVSIVSDSSEADVIACFEVHGGGIFRIYIEDKISAGMMPLQLERYLARAEADRGRGEIVGYAVVLFAPLTYAAAIPERVARISFEAAAAALRRLCGDARSRYRASFLERAALGRLAQETRLLEAEPYLVEWWDAVYAMLDREFAGFFIAPKVRYPRSVFIAPRTAGMPDYIRVDLKGHKGEVDLAFKNVPFQDLAAALAGKSAPGVLVENEKSAAIRIGGLAPFRLADGAEVIETNVREAYAAARDLLLFWRAHRHVFDELSPERAPAS